MDIKELNLADDNKQIIRHPWELARLNVIITLFRKFIAKKSITPATVIDIGCGDVFVSEQLGMRFPELRFLAIDKAFDRSLLVKLRDNLRISNVELYPSLESGIELGDSPAGAVFLLDVIEHIAEDEAFLINLYHSELIDDDARFLITVPAFQRLFSSHDTFIEHYRRYNLKQLRRVLERSQFEIIEQGYFFTSLLLPRFLQVVMEKLANKQEEAVQAQKGVANWQGNALLGKIIKKILIADFQFSQFLRQLGIILPGLSCYTICKKKII